jgi:hypothetical protein
MDNKKKAVKENKVGGSYKMRPSVKAEAMKYIAEDEDIKSFNDLLEVATIAYIKAQRKKPRDHDNQAKIDYE